MNLGFRSFEIVDAISQRGSLRKAAEHLGLSQPALTKALSALEAEVGEKLFERHAGGIEPTAYARVMLSRWDEIFSNLVELRRDIDRIGSVEEGRLRVATGYLAAMSAEIALGQLMRQFPALRIEARQLVWSDVATAVRKADVDIGVADPTDAENDPQLNIELIGERPAYFVCRSGHPVLSLHQPELKDILSYPMVMSRIPYRMAQYFPDDVEAYGFRRIGFGHLQPPIEVKSVSAICNVVSNSDAISFMTKGMIEDHSLPGRLQSITRYRPHWLKVRLGFIMRKETTLTPAIVAFIDKVRRIELGEN